MAARSEYGVFQILPRFAIIGTYIKPVIPVASLVFSAINL